MGKNGVWYAGFAVYAAGVALFSGPGLDHWWGIWAAGGYALAAVISALAGRWARGSQAWGSVAGAIAVAGAFVVPAIWLMTSEPMGPDVTVSVRAGVLLLHHGSPYLAPAALSAGGWLAYYPYLPVMALFGVPAALGVPGDTQPWLAGVTFLLLYATFRVMSASRDGGRGPDVAWRPNRARALVRAQRWDALERAAFWLACPIMAFPLTMGINDPAVIALTCLALALLARHACTGNGRPWGRDMLLGALVLAVACAMKYTAWPAFLIIAVMVTARHGVRSAVRFTAVTLAVAAGLVVAFAPTALRDPAALVANTIAYPLGLTTAKSPAASPLPGHLIAQLGTGGHLAALALLALAGLATAVWLVLAPPATPAAAARRLAIALSLLFLLSPATRFGYFIYPIALFWWAALADRGGHRPVVTVPLPSTPSPGETAPGVPQPAGRS